MLSILLCIAKNDAVADTYRCALFYAYSFADNLSIVHDIKNKTVFAFLAVSHVDARRIVGSQKRFQSITLDKEAQ